VTMSHRRCQRIFMGGCCAHHTLGLGAIQLVSGSYKELGMPRLLLAISFAFLTFMAGVWTRAAQQPGAAELETARFTGKNTVLEAAGVGATRRRFEAGARTAWHS